MTYERRIVSTTRERAFSIARRLSILASITGALALVQPAHAAAPDIKSGDYALDPAHTQILFHVLHFGFTEFSGIFPNAHGQLHIDTAEPAKSHLMISVPVATVETANPVLNKELREPEWLNVPKYPEATFVSQRITRVGDDRAKVEGLLTLNGVTKPLVLDANFVGSGVNPLDHKYTVGFSAVGHLHRSDFGVKKYLPLVSDDITLHIAGAFEKAD